MHEVKKITVDSSSDSFGLSQRLANLYGQLTLDLNTMISGFRILGAVVLISALSIFLFNDWQQGDDLTRYVALLGFTVLLVITGLTVGSWLRDTKAARLFLALGILSVPVNWLIQGALIYSEWQLDTTLVHYSGSLLWQAGDFYLALVVCLGAWMLLGFLSWLGFKVLAPRSSSLLTMGFLVSGSLFLLPVRHSLAIFVMACLMSLVIWKVLTQVNARDNTLTNAEGYFARAILCLPLVLLLGRSMVVYGFDVWMHLVIALTVFIGFRQMDRLIDKDHAWRRRFAILPIWAAAMSAFYAGELLSIWSVPHGLILPAVGLVFAALLWELASHRNGSERTYRGWADAVLVMVTMLNLMVDESLLSSLLCLVAGVVVLVSAVQQKRTGMALLGISATVYGIGFQISQLLDKIDLGAWSSLGAIGILLILSGSLLERYGVQWMAQFRAWRTSTSHHF